MASNLLEEMRRRHYSIRTEQAYCAWVKRYVLFHKMRTREDLYHGEKKIESFLSHLAIDLHVSPSTQNQAMNALVFLYKKVPVVLTRDETRRVISLMSGVHQLVVKLLYRASSNVYASAFKTLTLQSKRLPSVAQRVARIG